MTVCAIYVRKSSEENLERNLNDPNVQRFICEKYVKDKGWKLAPKKYDDIGYPGDTLERPALQELLQDVENGKIDCVVVYRLECLSTSFDDFLKIKDLFFDESEDEDLHCSEREKLLMQSIIEDKAAYEASLKVSANV